MLYVEDKKKKGSGRQSEKAEKDLYELELHLTIWEMVQSDAGLLWSKAHGVKWGSLPGKCA